MSRKESESKKEKDALKKIKRKNICYLFFFTTWFLLYGLCGFWDYSKDAADLIRGVLNLAMTSIVLYVTFVERYQIMKAVQSYKAPLKSDKLFLALGTAIVPFAAAMTDLGRVSDFFNIPFMTVSFLLIITLIETIVVLSLDKQKIIAKDIYLHVLACLILLALALFCTKSIGLRVVHFFMSQ